jgi:hypothetical protein
MLPRLCNRVASSTRAHITRVCRTSHILSNISCVRPLYRHSHSHSHSHSYSHSHFHPRVKGHYSYGYDYAFGYGCGVGQTPTSNTAKHVQYHYNTSSNFQLPIRPASSTASSKTPADAKSAQNSSQASTTIANTRTDESSAKAAVTDDDVTPDTANTDDTGTVRVRPLREMTPRRLFKVYADLAKAQLSALVVVTTGGGLLLGSVTCLKTAACAIIGTTLTAASANASNQVKEV